MNIKKQVRLKRSKRSRYLIKRLGAETGIARLSIMRSSCHIYAQVIAPVGGAVLASASTLELRTEVSSDGKIGKARQVGRMVAARAKEAGVTRVACDRSGFKYHGRVAALVEAAREAGIQV